MTILKALTTVSLLGFTLLSNAHANTVTVSGTLYQQAGGTTFDTWKINMQAAGSFAVNVQAYEASQSKTTDAGYYAADLNEDGELTWLDPDTHFYLDNGVLNASSHLARCDDIVNNCASVNTSIIQVTSRDQIQGATDGSIHYRRDPALDVTLAAGNYLYLIADYRLTDTEAASGINSGDSFSAPTGFVGPILDHGDYRITLSSSTMAFSVSGDTITVTAVPLPAAAWLFLSGLTGAFFNGRRKLTA